jgi:aldehyde dehydrogenase (NAD+)
MENRLIDSPASGVVRDYEMLVGGERVDALSGTTFESINPYTGRAGAVAPEAGDEDVDRAVKAARAAVDAGPWGTMTGTERARLMRRLADLLAENAQELGTRREHGQREAPHGGGRPVGGASRVVLLRRAADKIQGETIP